MSETQSIYLDNAATTRVLPEVVEAMQPFFGPEYGNPATLYSAGRRAKAAVRRAREELGGLVGADPDEIVITSGATESNNWILRAAVEGRRKHLVVSSVEHHTVLEPAEHLAKHAGVRLSVLPVDGAGRVDPEALREAVTEETALVSVMHANNEIGTTQPLAELAAIAHEAGALFHTDAAPTVGKIPVDMDALGADLLSLGAHKFHGPKGVGALVVRKGVRLTPFLHGGGQEGGRRAGTVNVPGAVGMGAAARLAGERMAEEGPRLAELVEGLWSKLESSLPKIRRNGHPTERVPGILNVCFDGVEGEALLLGLDDLGVQVSSGSACTTGSLEPSHVLLAIGLPAEVAHGSIRISLSGETTAGDIDRAAGLMAEVVARFRAMSPVWTG